MRKLFLTFFGICCVLGLAGFQTLNSICTYWQLDGIHSTAALSSPPEQTVNNKKRSSETIRKAFKGEYNRVNGFYNPPLNSGGGIKVVVIDAGHGGKDPGNLGTRRYSITEKDIALAVSLKLGRYIEENFEDVKVIYTRRTDAFIALQERADIANRAEADLFISIHCDAFNSSSVHGTTSLVLGKNHTDEKMRIAQAENSVIMLEENYEEKYEGFDPSRPETYIALTLYQNAFLNQSISFAQKVQDQFRERVKRRDRGVKQQPLYVTSRTSMPAVLIELGFLTNPREEDFLISEKGQEYMASAIFRAFREYKTEREEFAMNPVAVESPETEKQDVIEAVEQTPEEITKDDYDTYFTVQIITSGIKKDLDPENFFGVQGVSFYQEGNLYKYVVGRVNSLEEAEMLKEKMKESGFEDAFVVAMNKGKRITLKEASRILQ